MIPRHYRCDMCKRDVFSEDDLTWEPCGCEDGTMMPVDPPRESILKDWPTMETVARMAGLGGK